MEITPLDLEPLHRVIDHSGMYSSMGKLLNKTSPYLKLPRQPYQSWWHFSGKSKISDHLHDWGQYKRGTIRDDWAWKEKKFESVTQRVLRRNTNLSAPWCNWSSSCITKSGFAFKKGSIRIQPRDDHRLFRRILDRVNVSILALRAHIPGQNDDPLLKVTSNLRWLTPFYNCPLACTTADSLAS